MRNPPITPNRSEMIRAAMEADLRAGILAPGQVLDERSLGRRFGVSRTPVRQAIAQLASQGLLKVVPRVGVIVSKLTPDGLSSVLEMLAELEGICAKFAARRMDITERMALKAAVLECELATAHGQPKAYAEANTRFHELLYRGARNDWAAAQVRSLRTRSLNYERSRFDLPGRLEQSLSEHRLILAAIEIGDQEAARLAMIAHISVGGRDFADLISTLDPDVLAVSGAEGDPFGRSR